MSDSPSGPASFSFESIRDAVLLQHDFEIGPLWDWLKIHGRIPRRATETWNIVSAQWGIYAGIKPPSSDRTQSEEDRRRRGVWSVLEQCFRDIEARSPKAAFLLRFAEVLSRARRDLRVLTKKIDNGAPQYLQAVHAYLRHVAGRAVRDKRRILNRIDLPGPAALRLLSTQFRTVDRSLAVLHADLTRRLSAPVPVASRTRRGHPGRLLLKRVQDILYEAGFQTREVTALIVDRRSKERAVSRTRERRRSPRRTRANKVRSVDQFPTN